MKEFWVGIEWNVKLCAIVGLHTLRAAPGKWAAIINLSKLSFQFLLRRFFHSSRREDLCICRKRPSYKPTSLIFSGSHQGYKNKRFVCRGGRAHLSGWGSCVIWCHSRLGLLSQLYCSTLLYSSSSLYRPIVRLDKSSRALLSVNAVRGKPPGKKACSPNGHCQNSKERQRKKKKDCN